MLRSTRKFPELLLRVNDGRNIKLRQWSKKRTEIYDIRTEHGEAYPKALDPKAYTPPNGISMRPNNDVMRDVIHRYRSYTGEGVFVYSVPKDTVLPHHLLLVYESNSHYSLQPGEKMTLKNLNAAMTEFLERNAPRQTREEWLWHYESGSGEK